jgi:agmatine/peptidylarginine deiminase
MAHSFHSFSSTPFSSSTNNENDPSRMLVLLAAPSFTDDLYVEHFTRIVDFQVSLAKTLITAHDNVIVVVDPETVDFYAKRLPGDVLLINELDDIRIRDYSLINPVMPVRFVYTPAGMSKNESKRVQRSFDQFVEFYNLSSALSRLYLDGGNVVDNYAGGFVTTNRVVEDNRFGCVAEAKDALAIEFKSTQVAVIPADPDEPVLGHSDNMVMWVDEQTLLVNDYCSYPRNLRGRVMQELSDTFPYASIVEMPFQSAVAGGGYRGMSSVAGLNVNSLVTYKNIVVPVYGMCHEEGFVGMMRSLTDKLVVTVDASRLAELGVSVRSMTSQLVGDNARKLIQAARTASASRVF